MIPLIAASAIFLLADQATITAPTIAYKDCLKQTSAKAKVEKIAGDAYEAYARNACAAQITGLRNALIAFEVKNGAKRIDAAKDADMTIDDYLASSTDNYKFLAGAAEDNAKAAAAPTPAPPATPASAPQPPK